MIKVMDDEFILEKARVAEKARVETRAIERARLKAEKMAKQKLAIQMIKVVWCAMEAAVRSVVSVCEHPSLHVCCIVG